VAEPEAIQLKLIQVVQELQDKDMQVDREELSHGLRHIPAVAVVAPAQLDRLPLTNQQQVLAV
jgi:hypothetical protein